MTLHVRGSDKDPTGFIDVQNHRFFSTETVGIGPGNPERLSGFPAPFELIHSKVSGLRKKEATEFFHQTHITASF
jgi:hypothetical protein